MPNPISLQETQNHQNENHELLWLAAAEPTWFPVQLQYVSNTSLIITITVTDKQYPDKWKIFISPLIQNTIKWYHETLGQCSPPWYGAILIGGKGVENKTLKETSPYFETRKMHDDLVESLM